MFLQPLDLTTALRPFLQPDETLLLVQDNVGLYEGKQKIPTLQEGHAYLTTHRACYVDNGEPRKHSVAIELKTVEKCEFYAGFLKSSPKVTICPKDLKKYPFQTPPRGGHSLLPSSGHLQSSNSGSAPAYNGSKHSQPTWVCHICSFSNPFPSNFDPTTANSQTPLPPCLACGIKPSFPHILKAAIAAASGRQSSAVSNSGPSVQPFTASQAEQTSLSLGIQVQKLYTGQQQGGLGFNDGDKEAGVHCSRCTFLNHASLPSCELCGAPLPASEAGIITSPISAQRSDSPAPSTEFRTDPHEEEAGSIKFSFRAGGEKAFYEKLEGALTQRKWLLNSAPRIPDPVNGTPMPAQGTENLFPNSAVEQPGRSISAGIAGLERRELEQRQKNEVVIGSAFSDLDALRASAKEIIALAESFANQNQASSTSSGAANATQLIAESARALDMVTTKDITGGAPGNRGDGSLYLSEMSRNLAEYLTDDSRGVLKREGGIMGLVDLWAVYNRARSEGGVDFVSAHDLEKATRLWEKLKLPVRLRQFKNGLLVVQEASRTDDKTIAQLLAWLQDLRVSPSIPIVSDYNGHHEPESQAFGRGVTVQETAQHFGWSVGVASEELDMAEEKGALCRDEKGATGVVLYWENWILNDDDTIDGTYYDNHDDATAEIKSRERLDADATMLQNLKEMGIM